MAVFKQNTVAVFRVTQDEIFRVTRVEILRIVQGGKFTRKTVLKFYVYCGKTVLCIT